MMARKRFGQHFLAPAWAEKLVAIVHPAADDLFLEIGPGRGALTLPLAARAGGVIAVEIDRDLVAELARVVPANVRLISHDFLKVNIAELLGAEGPHQRVRAIGNLPYSASSPMLFRLLDLQRQTAVFSDFTCMLQREVADRLLAVPGSADYGVLAILVGLQAEVVRLLTLPPGAFRPIPKVSSAVVQLRFRPLPAEMAVVLVVERLVRSLFTQRRKTLLNALKPFATLTNVSAKEALAQAGLDPSRRPQNLDLAEIIRLAEVLAAAAA